MAIMMQLVVSSYAFVFHNKTWVLLLKFWNNRKEFRKSILLSIFLCRSPNFFVT